MSPLDGRLYFGIAARHLRQLGRELVANRTTAVAELVKNSYDADATRVQLVFRDSRKGGVLEVVDDGTGMTLQAIQDRWMRLSTDHKERWPTSPKYQRIRAGSKGIGRFATESLGEKLVLRTTVAGDTQLVVATFDWSEFDEPGVSLDAVGCDYRLEECEEERHGTTLRIEGLHQDWNKRDLSRVRKAIVLLQPPFAIAETYRSDQSTDSHDAAFDPGFSVTIVVGEDDSSESADEPSEVESFLAASTAVVEACVDESGHGRWRVRSKRFDVDESAEYPERLYVVGPFTLSASYFVFKRDAIGDLSVMLARDMGKTYGGIRIYRDGLRVPPYGEPSDDWVGLTEEYRKRVELAPIATNNWFGHVSLTRGKNLLLIDTASREGVVENEAFDELRTFVKDVLVASGRALARARGKKPRAVKRKRATSREQLVRDVLTLASEMLALSRNGEQEHAEAVLGKAYSLAGEARKSDRRAREEERAVLDEIALIRILASLGTSIVVFSHEVRAAINATIGRLVNLQEDAEDAPAPWSERMSAGMSPALEAVSRLDHLADYIEGYSSRSRRRERTPQALHTVLKEFQEGFGPLTTRLSVDLDWSVSPRHLRTQAMTRTELEAILVNLLTNSLKACTVDEGGVRRISVAAQQAGNKVLFRFQDTGAGVPEELRDTLFEPFVTSTRPTQSSLGAGTGLGLKIVRDIAEANEGSATLGEANEGFSTCVEVRLPMLRRERGSHD